MIQAGGRWPGGPLPVEEIAAAYRSGVGIIELSKRWGCSQSGVRSVLGRAGVDMRLRGGVRRAIGDDEIVRLRDVERMAWADMAQLTGLTDGALKARYDAAAARPARYRWQRSSEEHPDLSPDRLTELNGVIDHRSRIVASYLSGQASAMELSRIWGISDTTVRRWAAQRQANPEADREAEPVTELDWVIGEAQRELEAWTPRRRPARTHSGVHQPRLPKSFTCPWNAFGNSSTTLVFSRPGSLPAARGCCVAPTSMSQPGWPVNPAVPTGGKRFEPPSAQKTGAEARKTAGEQVSRPVCSMRRGRIKWVQDCCSSAVSAVP